MSTNKFKFPVYFFYLFHLVFVLSACGGGGSNPSATNNLVLQAIQVTDGNPKIGHPMTVSVSIEAIEATESVSVALFAIDKDSINARQLPLGESTIDMVAAGSGLYDLVFDIPATVEFPGEYHIAAIIDPLNAISEKDNEDNEIGTVATLSAPVSPNIFIKTMDADRSVILLDRASYNYESPTLDDVVNSDAGGTVSFGVEGSDTPIEVETFAVMRLTRSDTGATHEVPLYLWNSILERYMNAYGVDPVTGSTGNVEWLSIGQVMPQLIEGTGNVIYNDTDLVSSHLDFYFPGQLTKEIETVLRADGDTVFYPFATTPPPDLSISDISSLRSYLALVREDELSSELCVTIRPTTSSGVTDNIPADNEACSSLAFLIPPLPEPPPEPVPPAYTPIWSTPTDAYNTGSFFKTGWDSENFGYSLLFGAFADADEYGLKVHGFAELPITVFGNTFEVYRSDIIARVVPDVVYTPQTADGGYYLTIYGLGQLVNSITLPYGTYPLVKYSYSKEKTKQKTFFIYGIAVTVSGGAMGEIGVEVELEMTQQALQLSAGPFAQLDAVAEANANLFLAEVGATAEMTLVKEEIKIAMGSTIEVHNNGLVGGVSEVSYRPGLTLKNILTGADGKVSAYVGVFYPTMVRCSWGWLGEGYCPGTESIRHTEELVNWSGWKKVDTILDFTKHVDVITLQDRSVYYVTDGS